MKKNELKMTYSCIVKKGKQKVVRVSFEREGAYAEGIVPEGKIEKQKGFTKEEITQLELYLKINGDSILKMQKKFQELAICFPE